MLYVIFYPIQTPIQSGSFATACERVGMKLLIHAANCGIETAPGFILPCLDGTGTNGADAIFCSMNPEPTEAEWKSVQDRLARIFREKDVGELPVYIWKWNVGADLAQVLVDHGDGASV